ncbi:MAG: type VI secretion system tube protein Hcp [Planctomycetes bacterium]|nr:type VI secretion system tube protein Hcp [Planctomycetota bacterium]
MAFDCFLKIDGIKGDSGDSAHKEWIELESFNHKISQPVGGAMSAQGAHAGGRADHGDFSVTKRLDSATPNLELHCCNAKPIPNITIELCRAMGDKTVFMIYKFKENMVSSVQQHGSTVGEDPIPLEQVTFRYGTISWEYTPTDPTGGGKTGGTIQAGWSTLENKSV